MCIKNRQGCSCRCLWEKLMDREWMLVAVNGHLKDLKAKYRECCSESEASKRSRRSQVKRELDLCILVRTLLEAADFEMLEGDAEERAFSRLLERGVR